MEYLQIYFTQITQTQSDILIAQLNEINFDGFEEAENELKAFIPEHKFDENLFNNIIDINIFKYSKSIIKKENWNEQWESNFQPISVYHPHTSKPFVYLKASFHKDDKSFKYNIDVTPKMSFGTGHHATTFMMIEQMANINFEGKSVIDFGTGTGVLAILAEKMGATNVLAIDCDDWSIENTIVNIDKNHCNKIKIEKAETIPAGNKADIILANINLNIISDNIEAIKQATHHQSTILFSGIMQHDENKIIEVLTKSNIEIINIFKKDNWLALLTMA